MSEEVAFYILSAVAVLGALISVRRRNLVHGVFALMFFFAALAGLFLLLLGVYRGGAGARLHRRGGHPAVVRHHAHRARDRR
jgi:multisubunit Na+/H+ antiporter MnhC subunit